MNPRNALRIAVTAVTAAASLVTLVPCGAGREAYAQSAVATNGSNSTNNRQNQPSRLLLLKTGLDSAVWDPLQRGPLIAVAPQTVRPHRRARGQRKGVSSQSPTEPERLPGGRYRIADLAPFFERRLVRLQGLSVLAPTEMVVLNTKPGKPDYFAGLPQVVKMRMLQATLTPAQWKLLGSGNGLGADDLSGAQRDLFLSYLPDPIVLREQQIVGQGSLASAPGNKAVVVPNSQRSAIRLRVSRIARFSVPLKGDEDGSGAYRYNISSDPVGTEVTVLDSASPPSDDDDESREGTTLYGQRIRTVQPNRLKTQQIDFSAAALQTGISLAGIKTIGELVERIRTATRTEIYVDGRAAKLALWIRAGDTQTVRAGEALQALCWSLAGAIRYVGVPVDSDGRRSGVFILTQDLAGIGSRVTRIRDWSLTARDTAAQKQNALLESNRKQEPLQYLGFAPDDPYALDTRTNKMAEEAWKTIRGRWDGAKVSLSELPPQQLDAIRAAMVDYDKNKPVIGGRRRDLASSGSVRVSVSIRSSLLVPGVGEVRTSGLDGQSGDIGGLLPPAEKFSPNDPAPVPSPEFADVASIPAKLIPGSALCVSPTTEQEARKVVQTARSCGLRQVWLVLPVVPVLPAGMEEAMTKSRALLAAAILEAQREKPALSILAGVRLFRLPSVSAPETLQAGQNTADLTITGELPGEMVQRRVADAVAADADPALPLYDLQNTPDWTAPGTEGMARRLTQALATLAQTPALAGMVLLGTAPPGYSVAAGATVVDTLTNTIEVGYSPAARIAFIRAAGYDPIDLIPGRNSSSSLSLPFFEEDDRRPSAQWNRFRTQVVSRTLSETHALLRSSIDSSALPGRDSGFPIFLQNLDAGPSGRAAGVDWFSRWDKAEPLPRRSPKPAGEPQSIFANVQVVSPVSLLDVGCQDYSEPLLTARRAPTASDLPRTEPVTPSARYARSMNALLGHANGSWAGVVLNLSDVPVDKALEIMESIVSPQKVPLPGMRKKISP